jgi:putative SOS response-associated peptidase YedK
MPVMLDPETGWKWLTDQTQPELNSMLTPYVSEKMEASAISRAVNNVKQDDSSLILPLAH